MTKKLADFKVGDIVIVQLGKLRENERTQGKTLKAKIRVTGKDKFGNWYGLDCDGMHIHCEDLASGPDYSGIVIKYLGEDK